MVDAKMAFRICKARCCQERSADWYRVSRSTTGLIEMRIRMQRKAAKIARESRIWLSLAIGVEADE